MAKATQAEINRQAKDLVALYSSLFEKSKGRKPVVNTYRDSWGFKDAIEDLGVEKTKIILEYFFKTGRSSYTLQDFFRCYDALAESYDQLLKDREKRAQIREETRLRVLGE